MPSLISFPDADVMAARLSDMIAVRLGLAIARDGAALLALSGGSTPKKLHAALARHDLDWSRVTVIPVDERWVGLDHAGSNEALIRTTLIDEGANARLVGLKTEGATPLEGLKAAEARLDGLRRSPDVVVFGMGVDGHTASWFPHATGLDDALDMSSDLALAAIRARKSDVTGELVDRITLTLPWCLRAPLKILLMQGGSKASAFEAAAAGGPVEDMPVRALLREASDLWSCWAPD